MNPCSLALVTSAVLLSSALPAAAQDTSRSDEAPSNSLLARSTQTPPQVGRDRSQHALSRVSMFIVPPPQPREFRRHDLVQIVVRETSRVDSRQRVDTRKQYDLEAEIARFPDFNLADLLQFQLNAGRTTGMPSLDISAERTFRGDGSYRREDDMTARLTAEVIEILPNGNLVLEARTFIKTDREETTIKVTGICRQEDVSGANTILSNQLHDLHVEKMNRGELKSASDKGIISRVLDAIFAF